MQDKLTILLSYQLCLVMFILAHMGLDESHWINPIKQEIIAVSYANISNNINLLIAPNRLALHVPNAILF